MLQSENTQKSSKLDECWDDENSGPEIRTENYTVIRLEFNGLENREREIHGPNADPFQGIKTLLHSS